MQSAFIGGFKTLPANIETLISSRFDNETWLCALFETGGQLIYDAVHDDRIPIGEGLESPRAAFLQSGLFVVAGIGELHAYHFMNSRPELVDKLSLDIRPIGVTATDKIGQFALFDEDGTVRIFAITLQTSARR
jgi:hypothetical protein